MVALICTAGTVINTFKQLSHVIPLNSLVRLAVSVSIIMGMNVGREISRFRLCYLFKLKRLFKCGHG